jgi:hypothetical protein
MLTKRQAGVPPAGVRRAFGLQQGEARALWQTPGGEWVVAARGRGCPFVLRNLDEWDELAPEEEVELTADAGRLSPSSLALVYSAAEGCCRLLGGVPGRAGGRR